MSIVNSSKIGGRPHHYLNLAMIAKSSLPFGHEILDLNSIFSHCTKSCMAKQKMDFPKANLGTEEKGTLSEFENNISYLVYN